MLFVTLVGLGKIALDEHIPSILKSSGFALASTVSSSSSVTGVKNFSTLRDALHCPFGTDLVSLCVPPVVRFKYAREAILAGKHVLMEKPPGATISELRILEKLAASNCVSLIYSWHSRHASMICQLKSLLAGQSISSITIEWLEDVNEWHPNQQWIREPGGFGVFDPGINAFSILTDVVDDEFFVLESKIRHFGDGHTAEFAEIKLQSALDVPVEVTFDWKHAGEPVWDIRFETAQDSFLLKQGGHALFVNGVEVKPDQPCQQAEYDGVYSNCMTKIASGVSDCDSRPLQLIADVLMVAEKVCVK